MADNPQIVPVPGVDEVFELEIDGDLDITPFRWKPLGPEFPKGKRMYRCRLLDLGDCNSLEDARAKVAQKSQELNVRLRMAPGAARESFRVAYPAHNGQPIVMGGQQWLNLDNQLCIACLDNFGLRPRQWKPDFFWSLNVFIWYDLWLVVEQVDA